jgi:hypothetical protein
LFGGFWVVKAQNTSCDKPAAARHCHGSLSSKPHLSVEGGGQPPGILSPASSAIEVRIIGRVPAALMAIRDRAGATDASGEAPRRCPGWVATDMGGPRRASGRPGRRQRPVGRRPARRRTHRRLLQRRPPGPLVTPTRSATPIQSSPGTQLARRRRSAPLPSLLAEVVIPAVIPQDPTAANQTALGGISAQPELPKPTRTVRAEDGQLSPKQAIRTGTASSWLMPAPTRVARPPGW